MEAALQHEVTAQAGAQAELSVLRAKLKEAVDEMEERCRGEQAQWCAFAACMRAWVGVCADRAKLHVALCMHVLMRVVVN